MPASLIYNYTDTCPACLRAIRRQIVGQCFISTSERNRILKAVFRMSLDRHVSGYPDPGEISMLTYSLRQEKFRIVREQGRGDPAAAGIQRLIDGLKQLEVAARQARPVSVSRLSLHEEWAGLTGFFLMLFSPVFSGLIVYLLPVGVSALALIVYSLLTLTVAELSQEKFAAQFSAVTQGILTLTASGLALYYFLTGGAVQ